VNNGLANCLCRTRHDTHKAILPTVSQTPSRREVEINSYQLAISSIRRKMLTLIPLKNSVCAHLVSLSCRLVAKLLASGENTRNHILPVENAICICPALLSSIYRFACSFGCLFKLQRHGNRCSVEIAGCLLISMRIFELVGVDVRMMTGRQSARVDRHLSPSTLCKLLHFHRGPLLTTAQ
jgi:hypothetical protein